ncbi:MAG TPA: hypothetical protein DD706_01145 [Nitrospiraceae bacterium]|nr:hypothetical protein [Nitrospiraceae bacterium]
MDAVICHQNNNLTSVSRVNEPENDAQCLILKRTSAQIPYYDPLLPLLDPLYPEFLEKNLM